MRRYLLALSLFAVSFAVIGEALAGGNGVITFAKGTVRVVRDGSGLAASPGMAILSSDTLETGAGSKARIVFDDGSTMVAGQDTKARISDLSGGAERHASLSSIVSGVSKAFAEGDEKTFAAGVTRGGRPQIVYPRGTLLEYAGFVKWAPVKGATSYSVVVAVVDGRGHDKKVVCSVSTTETMVRTGAVSIPNDSSLLIDLKALAGGLSVSSCSSVVSFADEKKAAEVRKTLSAIASSYGAEDGDHTAVLTCGAYLMKEGLHSDALLRFVSYARSCGSAAALAPARRALAASCSAAVFTDGELAAIPPVPGP